VLRTREVGIRMALGARKGEVLRLMLGQSSTPVLLGMVAGALMATGDWYILHRVLYGISRVDGVSFLGVAGLFAVISLVASVIPARRAMGVEPAVALRSE
jgi:putative ABC transport system permease protein